MTNGEKFKEVFGISLVQVDEGDSYAYVWLPNHTAVRFSIDWWNAEYKEPKTGHWIKPEGKVKPFGDDTIQCDMCGFFTDVDCNYNYCPNCGSRMVKPQESEK